MGEQQPIECTIESQNDALIHLSNKHREAIQNRFKTEWWVVASIIGLSGAVHLNIDSTGIKNLLNEIHLALLVVSLGGVLVLYFLHKSNQMNRSVFIAAERELAKRNDLQETEAALTDLDKGSKSNILPFHPILLLQAGILVCVFLLSLCNYLESLCKF